MINAKTSWNIFNKQNHLEQITILEKKNFATNKKYILRKLCYFKTFETANSMFLGKQA